MRTLHLAIVLVVSIPSVARPDDWPSFRGPLGTGVSAEKATPLEWSDKQNVRWRVKLPDRGNSTPAVWGDRVYLTQATDAEKRREVIALDAATGKEVWRAGVKFDAKEPTNKQNPYCAASPSTDGERVVAFFGTPGLYCYDSAGKEMWHKELGEVDSWHGSGSSPVIHDGVCFLNFGPGTNAALYAFDVKTGKELWKQAPPKPERPPGGPRPGGPRPMPPGGGGKTEDKEKEKPTEFERAGGSGDFSGKGGFNGSWCTPLVLRAGDRDELVLVESSRVAAYDPKTGKELWFCKGLPMQVFASPAIGDGVLVAMGHNLPSGTKAMAVKLGGTGDVSESHRLWQVDLRKECIGSGVVANGGVFLVTETGMAVCLDVKTGKQVWEERLPGGRGSWSSLVLTGDRLLATNQTGQVSVLAASKEYDLTQSNEIPAETTCSSPAVAGGAVFLRTHASLWCFSRPATEKRADAEGQGQVTAAR